ncbi:sensor histidine kinase [Alkalicoccus luteus]|uniref:histidine kinase n=1 Tax=Alkalicoccus luteus TaxID=1237094 RepID=A0A969PR14_9BACI|nr:HAMP domain-containing sensor histidine kinase [Alkalicoccus luteus]NJP37980.1 HAMP domain-containing histidine kinase [Alkalicoccus luteus]
MFNTVQKQTFFFAMLIAVSGILLMGAVLLWAVERNFGDYVSDRQEQLVEEAAAQIESEYAERGSLESIPPMLFHSLMMEEGMSARLYDEAGNPVQTGMMHQQMMTQGDGEERAYRLEADGALIGVLEVTYPSGLGGAEQQFLQDMVLSMLIVLLVLIGAAAFFSHVASRRLTGGLRSVGEDVLALQHKERQIPNRTYGVQELDDLAAGVAALARSLEEEDERRRRFTGDLAHELRTPLGALRSQLEAFQDGVLEPTEERLERSHDELMRLVRLVGEMEQLYESEREDKPLQQKRVDLRAFIRSLEADMEAIFQEKGVALQTVCDADAVQADPDKLRQIVTNLLHNAWKFTPVSGTVVLEAREEADHVVIQVADEGPGLSPEEEHRVFDRFYRGDASRSREKDGLGIGLSIAAALARAHGGMITAENKAAGGAVFRLSLPKET